ncbi:hypothetical protein HID58_065816 [Brassica napus]|uniref:Uncharacterized protein n=1 Tax=Brassica napus TaxID=3708 RepID=A0ABQ7ZED3_BRANA|nr:hypothetical protein HID58_065816 [Brassica napus]
MKSSFPGLPSPASTEEEGHASALGIFTLYDCQELKCVPPLPWKLKKLNQANYFSLESISDLSKLQILDELNLTNCEKVDDVPGLEHLKALKRLYMSGCNSRFSVAVKKRLSKASLKMMRNLSLPGNRIPDWPSHILTSTQLRAQRRNPGRRRLQLRLGQSGFLGEETWWKIGHPIIGCSRLIMSTHGYAISTSLPFSLESDTRSTGIRGNETSATRKMFHFSE